MIIVALGAGVNEKGYPSEETKKRLEEIKTLYKKYGAPILLCGKYSFLYEKKNAPKNTEARSMYEYLLREGVKEEDMMLEEESQDTVLKAYNAKTRYFLPSKENTGVVVTSDFNLERIRYIFQKIFGKNYDLHYIGVPSSLPCNMKGKIRAKQIDLMQETEDLLRDVPNGDHEAAKEKMLSSGYHREKRSVKKDLFKAGGSSTC